MSDYDHERILALEAHVDLLQSTLNTAATKMAVDESNLSHLKDQYTKISQELEETRGELIQIRKTIATGRGVALAAIGFGSLFTGLIAKWDVVKSFFH